MEGSRFVFGPLGDVAVWSKVMNNTLGAEGGQYAVIFAFQILPTIIFIAALFAILYFLGVMQIVVRLFAVVMNKVMGASGAESLNVAASIFMGQTEAPLTIRPFLARMTQSELMTVMTSGMAHISGGIMAAYIAFGIEARHLLTAVIMTAPGTLMMAKMFVPETETPETRGTVKLADREDRRQHHRRGRPRHRRGTAPRHERRRDADFVRRDDLPAERHPRRHRQRDRHPGVLDADDLWLGVRAGGVEPRRAVARRRHHRQPARHAHGAERVHRVRAARRAPGVARSAFRSPSPPSRLCGFANFASIGMQIGGIGALAPTRRSDLARLGLRAMLAGTLANFITAIIVGFLL